MTVLKRNPTEDFLGVCAQERSQLLSFIIVGGGPTGIEVAAELHDMVVDDLRRIYPDLIRCRPARLCRQQ